MNNFSRVRNVCTEEASRKLSKSLRPTKLEGIKTTTQVSAALVEKLWGTPVLPSSLGGVKRCVSLSDEVWLFINTADCPSEGRVPLVGAPLPKS